MPVPAIPRFGLGKSFAEKVRAAKHDAQLRKFDQLAATETARAAAWIGRANALESDRTHQVANLFNPAPTTQQPKSNLAEAITGFAGLFSPDHEGVFGALLNRSERRAKSENLDRLRQFEASQRAADHELRALQMAIRDRLQLGERSTERSFRAANTGALQEMDWQQDRQRQRERLAIAQQSAEARRQTETAKQRSLDGRAEMSASMKRLAIEAQAQIAREKLLDAAQARKSRHESEAARRADALNQAEIRARSQLDLQLLKGRQTAEKPATRPNSTRAEVNDLFRHLERTVTELNQTRSIVRDIAQILRSSPRDTEAQKALEAARKREQFLLSLSRSLQNAYDQGRMRLNRGSNPSAPAIPVLPDELFGPIPRK